MYEIFKFPQPNGSVSMRVSVIIPTIPGRESVLKRAISSVREAVLDFEIVVVSKQTVAASVLQSLETEFPKVQVKLVLHNGVGNAASNRNIAIDQSSGEYIAFLDDDDEFVSGKLTTQINAMEKARANWSFSNYWLHDEKSNRKPYIFSTRSMLRKRTNFDKNCAIATPTVVIKRSVLEDNDLKFNSELQVREDVDLWTRLLTVESVLYVPQALAVVHRSVNSAFQVSARGSYTVDLLSRSAHNVSGKIRRTLDSADSATNRTHIITRLGQRD
jgi:glycosyltransferase involved in cell wall biosynthesis